MGIKPQTVYYQRRSTDALQRPGTTDPDMAMGWVGLGWVGLGRVRSNMIHCRTALVNISCNHEYFLIPWFTFIFRKFSVNYELSVPFFLAESLTVFRNNSRVMINNRPSPMNPISSTTQLDHGLILLVEGESQRISTVGWGCQAHPLHLNQLCPVGERLFSGQPYHYWRSFKAVAENCWSNGTHSLGSAWFSGSLLNMI